MCFRQQELPLYENPEPALRIWLKGDGFVFARACLDVLACVCLRNLAQRSAWPVSPGVLQPRLRNKVIHEAGAAMVGRVFRISV